MAVTCVTWQHGQNGQNGRMRVSVSLCPDDAVAARYYPPRDRRGEYSPFVALELADVTVCMTPAQALRLTEQLMAELAQVALEEERDDQASRSEAA